MEINLNDKDFLAQAEDFTGGPFKRKTALEKLIEVAVNYNKVSEFEKLIFTAKYVCGLLRVIKNAAGIPEVTSTDYIKDDLNENIIKATEQMKEIVFPGDEVQREYFNYTYFNLNAQNITNLTELFSDLESVKKYINHLKRLP
jgi:hypothetical protein